MSALNEDSLVQQTTADYLRDALGWNSILAFNDETFGPGGTLGRNSDREVVLTRFLRAALEKLNLGLPATAYEDAVRRGGRHPQSSFQPCRGPDPGLRC